MIIFEIFRESARYKIDWISNAPGLAEGILGVLAFLTAILLAISLHEAAHGFVALKCGDPTAKQMGRLTLNPVKHFEPLGMLMLLAVGFGWAKPVPVNPTNFKNQRRGSVLVSLAGIVTNLITVFLMLGVFGALFRLFSGSAAFFENTGNRFWYLLFYLFYWFIHHLIGISVALALFNLIPVFPLDGYRLLEAFVGSRSGVMKFLRDYGMYILLGLLLIGVLLSFLGLEQYSPINWYINTVGNGIIRLFELFWGLFGL